MSLKDKRIGIMMGGLSAEREISLKSGSAVFHALKTLGLDVVPLEVMRETEEEIHSLIASHAVDIVFIAMHGGFGEGGALQYILEKINMPYTGSREKASRLAMDKIASRQLFEKAELHVPKYQKVHRKSDRLTLNSLRYPLVVKPSAQGSSIGISFIDTQAHPTEALAEAFKFGDDVLIEEFIRGREVTVSVLDGQALPIVEIIPKKKFFDFQAKYEKGLTDYVVPAPLSPEEARHVQRDAVIAYHALGCRHFSRVDMILADGGTPYVLEVNTIPGMTEMSLFPKAAKAAGMSFDQVCTKLLELALETNKNFVPRLSRQNK